MDLLSEKSLRFRKGLHFAAVQGEGVLLDLVEDRYWGLYGLSATIWQGLLDGLDRSRLVTALGETHALVAEAAGQTLEEQLAAWSESRLLVPRNPGHSEARLRPPVSKPPGTPPRYGIDSRPAQARPAQARPAQARPAQGAGFGLAQSYALAKAKAWTVRGLGKTRLDRLLTELEHDVAYEPRMWPHVIRTVAAYRWLRRLFFRHNDCLPRTLLLARALQQQKIPYDICFGVRKVPLQAHAWLEVDGTSVLDCPERLAPLSVIARF